MKACYKELYQHVDIFKVFISMAQDCLPSCIFHIYLLKCQETGKNATMQQIMLACPLQGLCSLLKNIVYISIGLLRNDTDLIMTVNS